MNKKGFTLVEILAVIVLLGLIMTIVGTKGFGAFDNTKKKINEQNIKAIEEAGRIYMVEVEECDDDIDNVEELANIAGFTYDPDNNTSGNSIVHNCKDLIDKFKTTNSISVTKLKDYISNIDVEDDIYSNSYINLSFEYDDEGNITGILSNYVNSKNDKTDMEVTNGNLQFVNGTGEIKIIPDFNSEYTKWRLRLCNNKEECEKNIYNITQYPELLAEGTDFNILSEDEYDGEMLIISPNEHYYAIAIALDDKNNILEFAKNDAYTLYEYPEIPFEEKNIDISDGNDTVCVDLRDPNYESETNDYKYEYKINNSEWKEYIIGNSSQCELYESGIKVNDLKIGENTIVTRIAPIDSSKNNASDESEEMIIRITK